MSSPIAYLAILLSLGIWAGSLIIIPIAYSFAACLISASLFFFCLKSKRLSVLAICVSVFFLGMLSCTASNMLPNNHISRLITEEGETILLVGNIVDDPVESATSYKADKSSFTFWADSFKRNGSWQNTCGLVKVSVYSMKIRKSFVYGEKVLLEGRISKPTGLKNEGLFDYSKYLALNGIYSVFKVKDRALIKHLGPGDISAVRKAAYYLRRKVRLVVDKYFSNKAADNGFLKALLVGDRNSLKRSTTEDFIKTGTVHILSISGTHVGLVACVIIFILTLARVPRRPAVAVTMVCLIFYQFVAGLSPPIVRSTIMYCIFALGYIMNREGDILNSLSIAAFLMLLCNPNELFDPGFQLSFSSIASIIILTKVIDPIFRFSARERQSVFGGARRCALKALSVSIAAWIGAAPIVAYYFNITSPVSIIANLVVVPAVSLIMILSFAFVPLGLTLPHCAAYLAWLIRALDWALFYVNRQLSILPFSYFRVPAPDALFIFIYYLIILAWVKWDDICSGRFWIGKAKALIAILALANIYVWSGVFDGKGGRLEIDILDVGQGDSAYIEFPGNGNILVDGGSGGDDDIFDAGRYVVAPYLWSRGVHAIDAVVVTHFHEDHLGGLIYVLGNFKIGCVIDSAAAPDHDNKAYLRYMKILKENNIKHITVRESDVINFYPDGKLLVLNPVRGAYISDSNENSLVVKLVYKSSSALLCADIGGAALRRLAGYGTLLKSDILKVPHHGGSSGDLDAVTDFLREVSPRISVISVGAMNRFHMPSQDILSAISSIGSAIYQTKDGGAVRILIDKDGKGENVIRVKN